jgi:hypothetical protein
MACFATAEAGAADVVDGTYTGERVLTRGDPSACVVKDAVSATIQDGQLTFTNSRVRAYTISFSPRADGSFGQLSANVGGVVVDIRGRVADGVLDSDVASAQCEHHWQLERRG